MAAHILRYAHQIIERRKWQYPGRQRMAGIKQDAQEDVVQNFAAGFADPSIHPFINNGRTRRPLTPIKYIENT